MQDTPLRVGILETGRPPEDLGARHGDYIAMAGDWIAPDGAEVTGYAVLDGVFPEAPTDADLWVITGSRFAVYEDHPWIAPLESFIRDCQRAGVKMVGICFGHQIIAQALGGLARKSHKGWGLGIHSYDTLNWPEALGADPGSFAIQAYHQDQVEQLPDGAVRIATSGFCENAAAWYPGFAVTVQGHPEFAKPYMADLLEFRRGSILAPSEVDDALARMSRETSRHALADLIANHLDSI